jgi:hypothetical protein
LDLEVGLELFLLLTPLGLGLGFVGLPPRPALAPLFGLGEIFVSASTFGVRVRVKTKGSAPPA